MLLTHRLNVLLDQARLALDPRTVPRHREWAEREIDELLRIMPTPLPTRRRARGDSRLRPGHPALALERRAMIDTVGSVGATAIDSPLADVWLVQSIEIWCSATECPYFLTRANYQHTTCPK
jgi:hypothetical protein